ncbi:TPA: ABC transporter ATP-binding protein [Staphylococcus aureus]
MIEINNLSKRYRNKQIFNHLSMSFESNRLTVLLGDNGAGKSTLLRMIAGIEKANDGTINYFGEKWNQRQIQNHIGYVPQDIALFEHMTVAENIKFFKSLCKNPINDTTINEYLQQLNFDDTSAKVSTLSGGNKRKINILVGLLGQPRILILDEPTVGIDLKSRHDIHQLLNIMKSKCLIILTTHHLDEVEALADDIKLIGQDPFYQHVLEDKQWAYTYY